MNKTFCKKSNFINFMFAGCLILFNVSFLSCGLDTFYEIKEPQTGYNEPSWDISTQDQQYFQFKTNEENQPDSITFLGTEVYYKIYNKTSTEASSIISSASNDSTSDQSARRLIETYKYQPLRSSNDKGANILIPQTGTNRIIRIQLSDYPEFPAEFSIYTNSDERTKLGVPVRSIPNNPTFNFKDLIGTSNLPKYTETEKDDDYGYSSTSEEIKEYYVYMFAVSVGHDISYSRIYSPAVYLGSVKISLE